MGAIESRGSGGRSVGLCVGRGEQAGMKEWRRGGCEACGI